MRIRLNRTRFVVTHADGREVQHRYSVLLGIALPFVAVAALFWWSARPSGLGQAVDDLGTAFTNVVRVAMPRTDSPLDDVEIAVSRNTFDDFERQLRRGDPKLRHEPGGNQPYRGAIFVDGKTPLRGEVALIAPPGHHAASKPSIQIKLARADARDGARRIDLHRPEDALALEAWLYCRLASRADLIAPRCEPVRLFVNRKFLGVYLRTTPTGRALRFASRRTRGTFVISGTGLDPWSRPDAWYRVDDDPAAPAPLAALCAALNDGASTAELRALVDVDAFARWAAVLELLGRGVHDARQLALFFAPRHGRFEPVAWPYDGARTVTDRPLQNVPDRLLAALAREPKWRLARDLAAERLARELGPSMVGWVDAEFARLEPDLRADPRLVERDPETGALRPVAVTGLAARRAAFTAHLDARRQLMMATFAPLVAQADRTATDAPAPLVLGPGTVTLDADVVGAPGQPVVILAGTRLRLRAGVGIYARGPTTIAGTAAEPVSIAGTGFEPWATLALIGPHAAGSRIAHLQTTGGSSGQLDHQRFDAALVVHDCGDVTFTDCRFGPSATPNDTARVSRSNVAFERCIFDDARRVGLDVICGTGRLVECKFRGAERNAIRIRSARFELHACDIDGGLRAGIAADEQARVLLMGCVVQRSDLGIECRDDSRVLARDCRIEENRIAISSELVGWRFERGGTIALTGCTFKGNDETDLSIRRRGRVLFVGTPLPRFGTGNKRVAQVEAIATDWLDAEEPER